MKSHPKAVSLKRCLITILPSLFTGTDFCLLDEWNYLIAQETFLLCSHSISSFRLVAWSSLAGTGTCLPLRCISSSLNSTLRRTTAGVVKAERLSMFACCKFSGAQQLDPSLVFQRMTGLDTAYNSGAVSLVHTKALAAFFFLPQNRNISVNISKSDVSY